MTTIPTSTTSTTTIKVTNWQRTILAAIAAGEITMIRPYASKAFADWYRPGAKPQHRRPTHTLGQLEAAGLVAYSHRLPDRPLLTRAGKKLLAQAALTNLMTRQ